MVGPLLLSKRCSWYFFCTLFFLSLFCPPDRALSLSVLHAISRMPVREQKKRLSSNRKRGDPCFWQTKREQASERAKDPLSYRLVLWRWVREERELYISTTVGNRQDRDRLNIFALNCYLVLVLEMKGHGLLSWLIPRATISPPFPSPCDQHPSPILRVSHNGSAAVHDCIKRYHRCWRSKLLFGSSVMTRRKQELLFPFTKLLVMSNKYVMASRG